MISKLLEKLVRCHVMFGLLCWMFVWSIRWLKKQYNAPIKHGMVSISSASLPPHMQTKIVADKIKCVLILFILFWSAGSPQTSLVTCPCCCHCIICYIGSPKQQKTPLLYLLGMGNHVNPGISNLHFICVAIPFFHFELWAQSHCWLLTTVERYFSISIHLLQWHACQGFPPNSTFPVR